MLLAFFLKKIELLALGVSKYVSNRLCLRRPVSMLPIIHEYESDREHDMFINNDTHNRNLMIKQ